MAVIITNADSLRQISTPINLNDISTLNRDPQPFDLVSRESEIIIRSLAELLPEKAFGLAAPQIGEFKRIFIVRLSLGLFIFVNPNLIKSGSTFASTEECLSLPSITKCVSRATRTTIKADII